MSIAQGGGSRFVSQGSGAAGLIDRLAAHEERDAVGFLCRRGSGPASETLCGRMPRIAAAGVEPPFPAGNCPPGDWRSCSGFAGMEGFEAEVAEGVAEEEAAAREGSVGLGRQLVDDGPDAVGSAGYSVSAPGTVPLARPGALDVRPGPGPREEGASGCAPSWTPIPSPSTSSPPSQPLITARPTANELSPPRSANPYLSPVYRDWRCRRSPQETEALTTHGPDARRVRRLKF
jgi:hypothetical protein